HHPPGIKNSQSESYAEIGTDVWAQDCSARTRCFALTPRGAWIGGPLSACAKDRCLSHRAADFANCTATNRPRPLAQKWVPSARGPPCCCEASLAFTRSPRRRSLRERAALQVQGLSQSAD